MKRPFEDERVLDAEIWETPERLTMAEWLDQSGSVRRPAAEEREGDD